LASVATSKINPICSISAQFMPKKYLLLLFSLFFFGFAAPQVAPTFLLASAGANVSEYASISAPILPKKAKKRPKSKPKKRRKPNAYSTLTFIYGILGVFFALWVLWGGLYIMRWIVQSMSNLPSNLIFRNISDLWTGLAIILLPLLLLVPFGIVGGRHYGGKKFKIWLTFFYFVAVAAVVFAMLFFIFGLLSQIWLLLAVALGLAVFGSASLFLCNRALHSYSNDNIVQPTTPDENIEWHNNEEEE